MFFSLWSQEETSQIEWMQLTLSPKALADAMGWVTEEQAPVGAQNTFRRKGPAREESPTGETREAEEPLREGNQEKRVFKRSHGQLCQRLLRCQRRYPCDMDIRFGSIQVMAALSQSWVVEGEAEPAGEAPAPLEPCGSHGIGLCSGQGWAGRHFPSYDSLLYLLFYSDYQSNMYSL